MDFKHLLCMVLQAQEMYLWPKLSFYNLKKVFILLRRPKDISKETNVCSFHLPTRLLNSPNDKQHNCSKTSLYSKTVVKG